GGRSVAGSCGRIGNRLLLGPGWQEFYQQPEYGESKDGQNNCDQQAFARHKPHLVSGVPEEALGKQLSANDDIPPHGENANQGQTASSYISTFALHFRQLHYLGQRQQSDGKQRAQQDLYHDMRKIELRVHHEVEAAEGFVGLIDAMDKIEHLQAEVDDEGVEQILGDRINASHVDGFAAKPAHEHVKQHDNRYARDHGGEQKHH